MIKHRNKMVGGLVFLLVLGSVLFLTVHGNTTFAFQSAADKPVLHFELELNLGLSSLPTSVAQPKAVQQPSPRAIKLLGGARVMISPI